MINGVNILPTDRLVFELEMLAIDNNEQKKRALRQQIADKYGVPLKNVEVVFKAINVDKEGNKISLTDDITTNLQKPEFQRQLIKELIEIQNIKDVNLEDIYEIDKTINSFIDFDVYSKHKSYKIKYIKWDNFLSYGKGNYFDFTKLDSLTLLNSNPENQGGKTSFAIALLSFALFGKSFRTPTLESTFNIHLPEATEVMVEACIEINNVDYVIRRTVNRPILKKRTAKSKITQKVEYFKLIDGNYEEVENCEAENGTQTNNIIRETVGSIDDFNLVISATVDTLNNLNKMGQTDKGKVFSRWLGLLSLEEKDNTAKDYYKTTILPKLLSNKYDKTTLENEIKDRETVILSNNNEVKNLQIKEKDSELKIQQVNNEKITTISKKKQIKEDVVYDIVTVESQLERYNTELQTKRSMMAQMKEEYMVLKDVSYNEELYIAKQNELSELISKNGELKGQITSNKGEINRISSLKEEKTCPTCGHPIDVVELDSFIEGYNKKNTELINEGVNNKKIIDKLKEEINKLEQDKENVNKLNNIKLKMSAVKVTIDNIKLNINECNRKKAEYEENKENIKFNNNIDNEIRILDEKIKTETRIKEQIIRDIQDITNANNLYNNEIKQRKQIIDRLTEEEKIIRNWTIYQQMVGKNGIIKLVLKRALPIINAEIERLLSGLCDFEVVLSISDDNKVCLDLIEDGKKVDLGIGASGFESTMASLALRCALGNIAAIPKPNFICFDEIIGTVSVSNYDKLHELFNRILNSYDFIIHITHNEMITDWHKDIITIVKDDKKISHLHLNEKL